MKQAIPADVDPGCVSLWRSAGRPALAPALTLTAAILLATGLALPVVTLRKGLAHDSYSVLDGIGDLAHEDEFLLAGIVLAFSVVFPIVKLLALLSILFRPVSGSSRARALAWLGLLGRWSMLDVFVIAILIGSIHLGVISEAYAERGVYVFAGAILASMLATVSVDQVAARGAVPQSASPPRSSAIERWTSVVALLLFAFGLDRPLMVVEKFRFWDHEYSVLGATRRMAEEGETLLAAVIFLFVVFLPLARLIGIVLLRFAVLPDAEAAGPRALSSERTVRAVLWLEKWAMLDVFGLALLVVVVKIGDVASVAPKLGFWLLLAAAALSLYDGWTLRQRSAT